MAMMVVADLYLAKRSQQLVEVENIDEELRSKINVDWRVVGCF
jgi:hypothetical protein